MIGERERVQVEMTLGLAAAPARKPAFRLAAPQLVPQMLPEQVPPVEQPSLAPEGAPRRGFQFDEIPIFPKAAEPAAVPEVPERGGAPAERADKQPPTAAPGKKNRSKQDEQREQEQDALRQIHHRLRTGIFDWRVTPEEADEVLEILNGLEPVVLLRTVQAMQLTDAWRKFMARVPSSDALARLQSHIAPLTGYLMPGDTVRLEIFSGAAREDELSGDYTVAESGLMLAWLKTPIRLVSLLPQQAANTIGQTLIDEMLVADAFVRLVIRTRGSIYAGQTGTLPDKPWEFQSRATASTPEGKRRLKSKAFYDYIREVRAEDPLTTSALLHYYKWVEDHQTKPELLTRNPVDLWQWALDEAYKPPPVSKLEPYYRIADQMSTLAQKAPRAEKMRLFDALERFDQWLDRHANDPKLEQYDPVDIWAKAYGGAVEAELEAERKRIEREALKEALTPRVDWDKAGKKLDDALKLLMTKVWAARSPLAQFDKKYGKAYLIEPSDAERAVRDQIASAFLDSVIKRMTDPDFTSTTARMDFERWLAEHPESLLALQLAQAYPDVSTRDIPIEVDIPTYQRVIEFGVLMIPVVGNVIGGAEAVLGVDLFGNELSPADRAILAAASLLPVGAKLFKAGKGTLTAVKIAKNYNLSKIEAEALLTAVTKIKPGSTGHALLSKAFGELQAGKSISDPRELASLATLFKEMGITDPALIREIAAARGMALTEREAATVSAQAIAKGAGVPRSPAWLELKDKLAKALRETTTHSIPFKSHEGIQKMVAELTAMQDSNPVNRQVLALLEPLWDGLQNPDLIAEVVADIAERALLPRLQAEAAKKGVSAYTLAAKEMSEETGARLATIPTDADILPTNVFFKDYVAGGVRFYDLGAGEEHGALSHMIQDLVVDRVLARVSPGLQADQFRALLAKVTGTKAGYRPPGFKTDVPLGALVWGELYDAFNKQINQPEWLIKALRKVIPELE